MMKMSKITNKQKQNYKKYLCKRKNRWARRINLYKNLNGYIFSKEWIYFMTHDHRTTYMDLSNKRRYKYIKTHND